MRSACVRVGLALAALAAAACGGPAAPGVPGDVAFVGANVIPMDVERVLENQTVVIAGGRIAAIGAAGEVVPAEGVEIIDAAGRYLLPGLAELHGHLPNTRTTEQDARNLLFLYLAGGVTTVRGMQGDPVQFDLRERVRSGALLGPQMFLGSVALSTFRGPLTPEEAEERVRQYAVAGYDLIKVLEGLDVATYDAAVRTAGEVGLPFAGHVPDAVGLRRALAAGQLSIDHLDNYVEALVPEARQPDEWPGIGGTTTLLDLVDESLVPEVVEATLRAGAWVVPTMVLWDTGIFSTRPAATVAAERPEVRYMPPELVARWTQTVDERSAAGAGDAKRRLAALRGRILMALYEAGANIALGTDAPQTFSVPGFSVHREMRHYVDLGMTPYAVLEIATRKPAEYFGATADFGTVAVGRRADLLLLDANPLEDITRTERRAGVMIGGRWLPAAEIDERLEAIAVHYGN